MPETASRIREVITNRMNSNTRAELRRQINGRCARRLHQYDSVTGTSSSIQGDILQQLADTSQDGSDSVIRMCKLIDQDLRMHLMCFAESQNALLPEGLSSVCTTDISREAGKTDQSTAKKPRDIQGLFEDDSDDDLSWYRSRVEQIRLI